MRLSLMFPLLAAEEGHERLLLGVLGTRRVARRRADAVVALVDQALDVEPLVGRVAPQLATDLLVQALREQDLFKVPGVAETIDWATALTELDARSLTPQVVGDTLGALLKYQDDIGRMQGPALDKVIKEAVKDPAA